MKTKTHYSLQSMSAQKTKPVSKIEKTKATKKPFRPPTISKPVQVPQAD